MSRPKSQDKRNAILDAATRVFAERGLSAATSAISAVAGIAEGTLFTYFPTKDDLINALYREIKLELADAMMSNFPRRKTVISRLEHVWNQYLDWGVANPLEHIVLRRAMVWDGLTANSRQAGSAPFVEIESMVDEAVHEHILQDLPRKFIESAMSALCEMTIDLLCADPDHSPTYREASFAMFWNGIIKR